MKIQILDKAKKKKIIECVEDDLGVSKIRELLVRTGKERIRAYSGNLSNEEIMDIWKILPIEGVGLYVGKEAIDRHGVREVRLSVDALHTWEDQIKGNIIVLSEEQEESWFRGKNIVLDEDQEKKFGEKLGFYAVKSADEKDFIGTGKIGESQEKNGRKTLYSYLPKERRRKN